MAHLPLAALRSGQTLAPAEVLRFTAPELRAIMLGEQADALRERRPAGPWSRRLAWLFGLDAPRPLADPHLEALRRFVSKVCHHALSLDSEDVEALAAAGYTAAQARGLTDYLIGRRCAAVIA